jgi:hypothetical protein
MCGAILIANLPAKNGVPKSIAKPIAHKINRTGGGTNADTAQSIADEEKPIRYLSVNGLAEGMRPSVRFHFSEY